MTASLQRESIGTLFSDNWGTEVPVAWPNRAFDPPDGSWVRFTLIDVDSFQLEIGAERNVHRHTGFVVLQVFTKLNIGDKLAKDLAERAAQIFRDNRVVLLSSGEGSVRFRDPTVRDIGPDRGELIKSSFYQVNVSVPFIRDSVY